MAKYSGQTPIKGKSRGNPEKIKAWLRQQGVGRPADADLFVDTHYADAPDFGINADVCIAQFIKEASRREPPHEPGWGVPWIHGCNPVGIGVTSDAQWRIYQFVNGRNGAHAHLMQLSLYVNGKDLPDGYDIDEPYSHADNPPARWYSTIKAIEPGYARILSDLDGVWAWPGVGYGEDIGDIMNRMDAAGLLDGSEPPTEKPMVTMLKYEVPTAPRPLYLPDWIQVLIKWVTHPNTTSRRKTGPKTRSTFHDTANPRTKAMGEWSWLAGGRQGGSKGGYNAIVDDIMIIICQYLDEETWHAGTPEGNLTSWGTELAYGGDTDWNKAFENVCAWHGALLEAAGLSLPEALVLHQFWTGKWCSAQVLNRGLVDVMHQKVAYYFQLCRAAREQGGGEVEPPGTPGIVKPVMPVMPNGEPWDGKEDVIVNDVKFEAQRQKVVATGNVYVRQWANTDSQETGPMWKEGEEREIFGWVKGQLVDGIAEWAVTSDGSRVWAGALDFEPKEDPDWPDTPPDNPPGMTTINGRLYYPLHDEKTGELGRTITIHRAGNLYKWADQASELVGHVEEDTERVFKYWTRGQELPLELKDGTMAVEGIWFAESLDGGPAMWSGLSEERPG